MEQKSKEITPIAPKTGQKIHPFIPQTMEEIKWTVGMVIEAGLAPDAFKTNGHPDKKKLALAIMKGLEVGLPPLSALDAIAIINGKACIWGDGLVALIQAHGVVAKMEEDEIGTKPDPGAELTAFPDDYGIEIRLYRRNQDSAYVGRFTVGDAKRAKLWLNPKKQPWMLYPKRMLRARAVGFAIRNGFADCLAGMMIREEAEDLPPVHDETPIDTGFLDDVPGEQEDQKAIEHTEEEPFDIAAWSEDMLKQIDELKGKPEALAAFREEHVPTMIELSETHADEVHAVDAALSEAQGHKKPANVFGNAA